MNNRPNKTLAEMQEILKQHAQGTVTDGEAILACQLHPWQLDSLLLMSKLPLKAYMRINIGDMEPDYERRTLEITVDVGGGKGEVTVVRPRRFQLKSGFYRSGLGRIYHIEERSRTFHALNAEGAFQWDVNGKYIAPLVLDASDFDLVAEVSESDYQNQGNMVEFKLRPGCCYELNDGTFMQTKAFSFFDQGRQDYGIKSPGLDNDWNIYGRCEQTPKRNAVLEVSVDTFLEHNPNAD